MKATQPDSIIKFITSNDMTFVIPVYQRNYVWKTEDCDTLFDDVLRGIKENKKHYFGNIVFDDDGRDPFTGFTRYILIDGQQRITSTMLLLAAIRDEEPDEERRQHITTTYLTNAKGSENFRVKLKQVETDRDVYEAIVERRMDDISKNSIIYRNYYRFRSLVKNAKRELGLTSAELISALDYLHVIVIDLESKNAGAESPQVIFESINATGEPLSTADLLRNFLLLEIGTEKQEEYYRNFWLTIEKNVGNENISDFVRRYITLHSNEDVRKDTEYKVFKNKYKDYFSDAEEAIRELAKYSKYYRWIKRPESTGSEQPKTSAMLQDVDDLRMLPATPAIMWLLEKADTGSISFDDVNNTLEVISSWSFRARITNIISTGEIGGILTTKILELFKNKKDDQTPYADYLWFELSNYRLRDIYPNDDVFREAFVRYDFYKTYRRYVQYKLASAVSHDQTEVVLESIEHIMPQTLRSDKWPGVSVSEHAEWVNTIGNLTPLNMIDNPAASNGSFEDKKPYLKASDWQMTREIVDGERAYDEWGIASIQHRAAYLSDHAVKIWKAPADRTRPIELVKNDKHDRLKKFVEWIEEFGLPYIVLDRDNSVNTCVRFTTDYMDALIPKRAEQNGGWRNGRAFYYELKSDATGWARVSLAFNSQQTTEEQKLGQEVVMRYLNKYPPKSSWIWHSPHGWTLEYDTSEDDLKDSLKKILEEEIPALENDLAESKQRCATKRNMV